MNTRIQKADPERLSFLTKATLDRILPHGQPVHFAKDARIADVTQLSEAAYLILSGSCELRRAALDAPEEVVETLGPGAAFGGVDGLSDDKSTIAVATADTLVLRIGRDDLDTLRTQKTSPRWQEDAAAPVEAVRQVVQLHSPEPGPPRQVVTLAFTSEYIPASLISEQLARSVCIETGASVVLVRFESLDSGSSLPRPELSLNGEFHMPSRMQKTEGGFYSLTLGLLSEPPSSGGIISLVTQLSRRFRHVLIETPPADRCAPWLLEFLLRSDLAYVFLRTSTEEVYQLDLLMREVRARSGAQGAKVKTIACLAAGEPIDGFDFLAEKVGAPVHLYVRGCPVCIKDSGPITNPTGSFGADVRRIAREIGGCLVGLALSSGAAKGFSHIGVIQVLEENGIEVDVVAGSSMGAYIGSLWSHGHGGAELERLAREMETRWALWSLIDPVFPPRQGFLRGFAVKKRLMRSIGTARFSDLARPLRVVAGNLETLERVVFSSGEVATAVHASIAVPGICVPVVIDGQAYIDGGVVDPLPVDVLREMGITRVIAVDAIPTPDRIRYGLQAEKQLSHQTVKGPRKLFRKVPPLEQQINFFARGNLFEILMRSVQGAQIRVAEASCALADLVLRPAICDDRWSDCGNPAKFIKLGREIAEKHLEDIKVLVLKREVTHEREFAPEPVATIA